VVNNHVAAEHYNVANELFADGHYEEAAEFYQRALERMDGEWRVHFNLALTRVRQSQWQPAISHFERVVKMAPENQLAAIALAEARCSHQPSSDCPQRLAQ
jgi:tetratricopeptide (TPR) repeat protein